MADGLELVPFDAAELDACELGVEGGALVGVDADLVTLDLIVLVGVVGVVGVGDEVAQGVPAVLAAFVLPGALTLEVADAVVLAPLLAGVLFVLLLAGVLFVLLLAGVLFVLLLAGLLFVLPLAGLDTDGARGALELTDFLVAVGAEEAGEHVVAVAPGWEMPVLAWPMPPFEPMPPFDEPSVVPGPVWFCGAALLGEVIPTC